MPGSKRTPARASPTPSNAPRQPVSGLSSEREKFQRHDGGRCGAAPATGAAPYRCRAQRRPAAQRRGRRCQPFRRVAARGPALRLQRLGRLGDHHHDSRGRTGRASACRPGRAAGTPGSPRDRPAVRHDRGRAGHPGHRDRLLPGAAARCSDAGPGHGSQPPGPLRRRGSRRTRTPRPLARNRGVGRDGRRRGRAEPDPARRAGGSGPGPAADFRALRVFDRRTGPRRGAAVHRAPPGPAVAGRPPPPPRGGVGPRAPAAAGGWGGGGAPARGTGHPPPPPRGGRRARGQGGGGGMGRARSPRRGQWQPGASTRCGTDCVRSVPRRGPGWRCSPSSLRTAAWPP